MHGFVPRDLIYCYSTINPGTRKQHFPEPGQMHECPCTLAAALLHSAGAGQGRRDVHAFVRPDRNSLLTAENKRDKINI